MEENATKVTVDQITAVLNRYFGTGVRTVEIKELGGGTFNETYLIEIAGNEKVVLRLAPQATSGTAWDDAALLRREHTTRPFFASIAPLLPSTLLADFTHQIVGRDYVLQTFLEGDRWSDIEDELTEEENAGLWRQCGEIVKQIHETRGEQFGYPYPGKSFANWNDVILDRFSRLAENLKAHQADIPFFSEIFEVVRSSPPVFHTVQTPHLLHGDLWTFNLLVRHENGTPIISGVLDTERAWWGDPSADWILFLLSIRREEEQWQERIAAFQAGYGMLEQTKTMQFRREVYNAMHVGSSVVWEVQHGNRGAIQQGTRDLERIADVLSTLRI